jgi:hypothetical protein
MKNVFFTLLFLTISSLSFSQQTARKEMKDDPIIQERIKNGGPRTKADSKVDVRVSEYFGLEEAIKSATLNNDIPSGCPKSVGYASKTAYIKDLNAWIKENPSQIKEEKKNYVITE